MAEIAPIDFEAGKVKITLTPPADPQSIGLALAQNVPFPDDAFQDDSIVLGAIKASASKDFTLDKASFKASASAFAGFAVYRNSRKLFVALKAEGVAEPMVTNHRKRKQAIVLLSLRTAVSRRFGPRCSTLVPCGCQDPNRMGRAGGVGVHGIAGQAPQNLLPAFNGREDSATAPLSLPAVALPQTAQRRAARHRSDQSGR